MKLRTSVVKIALLTSFFTLFVSCSNTRGENMNQTSHPLPTLAENICPLLIGAMVPKLTLTAADGRSFDLNAAITKKPTVLIFYRGGW